MNIRAGELTRRVELQRPIETRSESGAVVKSWETFSIVWAGITEKGSTEFKNADQTVSNKTVNVIVRYIPDLSPTMRLVYNGRILNILSIANSMEKNKGHILTCVEVI